MMQVLIERARSGDGIVANPVTTYYHDWVLDMARTDAKGKGLQGVVSYECDRAVPATEIYGAMGISRNTYHLRIEDDDFPNAEEIRLVAMSLGLNPLDLMLRFGVLAEDHVRKLPKISEMLRNPDVPPL